MVQNVLTLIIFIGIHFLRMFLETIYDNLSSRLILKNICVYHVWKQFVWPFLRLVLQNFLTTVYIDHFLEPDILGTGFS